MVASRTLRATACASCRLSILRSFTSLAGPSMQAPQASVRTSHSIRSSLYAGVLPRSFSNDRKLASSILENKEADVLTKESIHEFEEVRGADKEIDDTDGGEVTAIPWYLQVESPYRAPKPLSERQSLPEIPESSPPILQPLLEQISLDLGLDDLSLLDLRKLDPPPALGANLLMVLATARSEKHLHVSADRLCRWLRSNYKLRPDADGLLGRNELKLKLKRKAKRAKLVGSTKDDDGDDGVRTGWVCVDVGLVDGGDTTTVPREETFVGFGRRTDGVRIVVQMLTEEKRADIELEKLWSGVLKRGGEPEDEPVEIESSIKAGQAQISYPNERRSIADILGRGQKREIHTSARRMSPLAIFSQDFALDIEITKQSTRSYTIIGAYQKTMTESDLFIIP
ncbi:hypothetical protein WAI453_010645 [Rhynchosporium graminicola]|uniref:ATPase synthesis protein 25 n=1 Tax=Rhynchosporium graminicola TaxID=2792576 RepID=A0A1E1JSI4_9HELO|nr:uncharacterized protein RCO7_04478 [Rhynchosporium commune]